MADTKAAGGARGGIAKPVTPSPELAAIVGTADLPRSAWPPPNDLGASSLRIDDRARTLIDAARPSTTIVRKHDVEITFDGVFADAERLGAAIQLAGYWAGDHDHVGPYR